MTALSLVVRFDDGSNWAPDERAFLHQENPASDYAVRCPVCAAGTLLKELRIDHFALHDASPLDALIICRGTGREDRPACEHWTPITSRTSKDQS